MRRHSIRNSIGPKIPSYSKQRNIRDPAYKSQCIQKLATFLGDIDTKSLELPTVKEFQSLFRYFYMQYEPNTEALDSKFEDETVSFLKLMKYPYMTEITKSQLISISPHSWPALLSMLTWLSDISSNSNIAPVEESIDSLFYEFVCESFKQYMITGTESREKEEYFNKSVNELIKKREEETKKLKVKLKEEVEKSFNLQNKKLNEINSELTKFKEYKVKDIAEILENMRIRKEELIRNDTIDLSKATELDSKNKENELQIESLNSELNFYEAEVKNLKRIKDDLKIQVDNQGITISEVSSLRLKEDLLNKQIEESKAKKYQFNTLKSEEENNLNLKMMDLQKEVTEFVKVIKNKQNSYKNDEIFDITDENVFTKDLNLIIFRLKEILGECSVKFQLSISERSSLVGKKTDLYKQIERYNESFKELTEEIIELSNQYIKIKENFDVLEKRSEKEFDLLKKCIEKLKLEGQESLVIAEQEYTLALTKFDLCSINLSNKKDSVEKELNDSLEGISSRFSVIDDLLRKINKK
ncbi:hypothetical protein H312_00064, partial [Anncaliia algerae PRA339]